MHDPEVHLLFLHVYSFGNLVLHNPLKIFKLCMHNNVERLQYLTNDYNINFQH